MKSSISSSNNYPPVNAQSGWVLFIFGILIATFVGGGFRAFLSPMQLATWVEQRLALESPKFHLAFDKIEFALADGLMPAFGIRFTDLAVRSKNPCVTRSQVQINTLYIPIRMSSLFSKRIRFADIFADQVKIVYRPTNCNVDISEAMGAHLDIGPPPSPKTPTKTIQDTREEEKTFFSPIKSFFQSRFVIELEKSREWFESISINEILVEKGSESAPWFAIKNFNTDLNEFEDQIEITSQVKYLEHDYFREQIEPIDIQLQLSSKIGHISLVGRFKEGEITSHLAVNFIDELYEFQSQIKYLPIGEIIKSLQIMKLIESRSNPRLLWLSCSMQATGKVNDNQQLVLGAKACNITGEAGRIQSDNLQIMPFAEKKLVPFDIKIDKFSLKYFIDAIGSDGVAGLLTDFGKISGVLSFHSHEHFDFKGEIIDLEAMFSNNKKRRLQFVQKIVGEFEYNKERVSGVVNAAQISGGEFDGLISFNLDQNFSNGIIQIKVDAIKLNDQIDQLLFYGKASPLQIYGQAKLENDNLVAWRGNIGIARVEGEGWGMSELKLDSELVNEKLSGRLSIADLVAAEGSLVYSKLHPLYLTLDPLPEIQWSEIFMLLEIDKFAGKWSKFKGLDKPNNYLFSSKGQWLQNEKLSGWVSVDFPKQKLLNWDLSGTFREPSLVPTPSLLEIVAGENSTVKITKAMSEEKRIEALNRILESKQFSQLGEIRKKVISAAKKWLPDIVKDAIDEKKSESEDKPKKKKASRKGLEGSAKKNNVDNL